MPWKHLRILRRSACDTPAFTGGKRKGLGSNQKLLPFYIFWIFGMQEGLKKYILR